MSRRRTGPERQELLEVGLLGPRGTETVDAVDGDFVYVPPHAIHREANPSDETSSVVVVRSGTGEAVVNVEGPAPG